MLKIYFWLQKKLPKPLPEWVMIALYSALIFLILALTNESSPEIIYWDQ